MSPYNHAYFTAIAKAYYWKFRFLTYFSNHNTWINTIRLEGIFINFTDEEESLIKKKKNNHTHKKII